MTAIPQRQKAPQIHLTDQVNFTRPTRKLLVHDIPAYFIHGGSQPVVKVEFVFHAGSYHQYKPLQAYATAQMLKNGTRLKTSAEINRLWDFYGISLYIDAQKDIVSVSFFCLNKFLKQALELLTETFAQPLFCEDELRVFMKNKKQEHIVNQTKVQHLARVHFARLLFGDQHPYGYSPETADFDKIQPSDLHDFHDMYLHPQNCVCLVSGQIPKDVTRLLHECLAGFAPRQNIVQNKLPEHHLTPTTGKHKIPKKNTSQAAIRLGKLMADRRHPDYHKVSITNTLLGGFFGSRLMRNIRQDKGYTYGINSALVSLLKDSYFFISTQVGKEVRENALDEIYKELKNLRQVPADDHEFSMLKNYLSASFLRSFDGPFMQMEKFKEILLFDLGYSHYSDFPHILKNIVPQDILQTAEQYFHEKDMTELWVG